MTEVNGPRAYSSRLRESQAASTRRLVLDAARELFVAQGYVATTVDQIAERAGVSRPTVFRAGGGKPAMLRAIRDIALAGDDEPVPVAQRPRVAAVREEPDLKRAVELLAEHITLVGSRYAEIYDVVRVAARSGEEGLRQLWETEEQERLTAARAWIQLLRDKNGSLRAGVDVSTAIDRLWLLMAADNFGRLVHTRGWSRSKFQRWVAEAISALFA